MMFVPIADRARSLRFRPSVGTNCGIGDITLEQSSVFGKEGDMQSDQRHPKQFTDAMLRSAKSQEEGPTIPELRPKVWEQDATKPG